MKIRVISVRSADAVIRVPIVSIISTRIIQIASQTRSRTDFLPHLMKIRVVCVRSADAVIRVPIVSIISTRIIRIASQTRSSTVFFLPHFIKKSV